MEYDYEFVQYRASSGSKFVYDGWNVIAELGLWDSAYRSYTWGPDVSGSLQGAGGIGGLLFVKQYGENVTYYPCYDGNGNITAMVKATDGTAAAKYEYSPYGELLTATGTYAVANPFRFSTKYTDAETGLAYFGYRYYNPETGRWLNRDPIEEKGGQNIYGYVHNNSINLIDPNGKGIWNWLGWLWKLIRCGKTVNDIYDCDQFSGKYDKYQSECANEENNPGLWDNFTEKYSCGGEQISIVVNPFEHKHFQLCCILTKAKEAGEDMKDFGQGFGTCMKGMFGAITLPTIFLPKPGI